MPFIGDDEADHVGQPAPVSVEFADRELACACLKLGFPITPVETQWPEPEETIRRLWLGVAEDIVERARRSVDGD